MTRVVLRLFGAGLKRWEEAEPVTQVVGGTFALVASVVTVGAFLIAAAVHWP